MLDLYKNIKKRRIELGISQQELAETVGYSGKSMISQVEKGLIDLPTTMIKKFAEALKTTPSYLMGWEDENGNDLTIEFQDKNTTSNYRALKMYQSYLSANPEVKIAVDALLKLHQQDS